MLRCENELQCKKSSRSVTSMSNCIRRNFTTEMKPERLHIDSAHIFLYATTVLAFLTDFKAQQWTTVQNRCSWYTISISICTERNFTLKMKPDALGTPKYLFSMYFFCPCINLGLSDWFWGKEMKYSAKKPLMIHYFDIQLFRAKFYHEDEIWRFGDPSKSIQRLILGPEPYWQTLFTKINVLVIYELMEPHYSYILRKIQRQQDQE